MTKPTVLLQQLCTVAVQQPASQQVCSVNANNIDCAAGRIRTFVWFLATGNPRHTQQAGTSSMRAGLRIPRPLSFGKLPQTFIHYFASDSCFRELRAEDTDFGQTSRKCQDVAERFEGRKAAAIASRCQVGSSAVMLKRSRGTHISDSAHFSALRGILKQVTRLLRHTRTTATCLGPSLRPQMPAVWELHEDTHT